ncbi:MAG: sulfite exporter TauE/SafE family protein [Actinomycetota bacterium]|nr:sulfite exporter TauE/SafE family protein [Actinomycetota bacterium]
MARPRLVTPLDQRGTRRGTLARDVAVGIGVGAFSGALGVGGGIILVPFLVLALHMAQKRAQATALVMVAMAAGAGAVRYAIDEAVAWGPAAIILVGGLAGAWIGSHVVQRTGDRRLQIVFGIMLLIAGVRLMWPTQVTALAAEDVPALSIVVAMAYAVSGLAMGLLSALLGIGGGILLVPVLVTAFGFSQHLANGTSLTVMLPIALLGAIRLTKPGLTDWRQGSRFGIGSIVGALAGASLALALSGPFLRWAFAIVLLAVGARMTYVALSPGRTPDPPFGPWP